MKQHEQLGEIGSLYQEYREIIDPIDPNEVVRIPYYQEVVEDNLDKARKALPIDCDHETYQAAVDKATFATYTARDHALINHGFVGSIRGLLKELDKEPQDQRLEIIGRAALYALIPAEHQKGAGVVTEYGYYWGGKYINHTS